MIWFIRLWVTSNATQQESCFQLEDWRSFVSFEHILWTPSLQSHVWSTNRYIVLLARAWPPHPLSLGYRRKYFTVRDLACQQKFGKILKHGSLITLSDWKTQHHSSSATAHQPINHVKIIWCQLILIQTWNSSIHFEILFLLSCSLRFANLIKWIQQFIDLIISRSNLHDLLILVNSAGKLDSKLNLLIESSLRIQSISCYI